ncbi:BON domain-containing protein [Parvularcula dongshanensis]|uniref:Osmotically-inducible protein OsmY n=1 Tax=Parvularcula dongshanensis TaxID=1173995 RepID=A0A840HYR2_9PROT|nr:BON domain-containing protein [Parvularcula dongshanensis]MBB4657577.1 osmotically-inducible protein OsmY [Parvularcula dongshanensis]
MRLASLLAALAALSLTAGCVQNRSLGDSFGDATTDLNLKRQLLTDRTIKTGDIDASVFEGRLLLTGTVPTEADHQALLTKARNLSGVREVLDELRIGRKTTMRQGLTDAAIDQKLGAALLTDNGIYRANYQIVVSQGTVYLLGVAQGPNELERVTSHAATIDGVNNVVSHVLYVGDPRRRTEG